jgi:choline dehydrogenase-like flavoprotein
VTAHLNVGRCDVVVIGAGPAGITAARTLARLGKSVIVLEAGAATDRRPRDLFAAMVGNTTEALLARRTSDQQVKPYLAGIGVGGGTRINGLLLDEHDLVEPSAGSIALPRTTVSPERWTAFERAVGETAEQRGMQVQSATLLGDVDGRWQGGAQLAGVDLRPGHRVEQIGRDAGASHVVGSNAYGLFECSADHVVVAAGALATPRLLAVAGCASPELGRNLADHPSVALHVANIDEIDALPSRGVTEDRFGLAVRLSLVVDGRPFMATIYDRGGLRMVLVTLLESRSRGELRSTHAELNLLDDAGDRRAMREAVRTISAMLDDRFGQQVTGPDGRAMGEVCKAPDDAFDAWLRANEDGTYHATGTAAGGDRADTVTDRAGRVRGLRNVWVADASGLAVAPNAAPMAAIFRHAHTVATMIGTG